MIKIECGSDVEKFRRLSIVGCGCRPFYVPVSYLFLFRWKTDKEESEIRFKKTIEVIKDKVFFSLVFLTKETDLR